MKRQFVTIIFVFCLLSLLSSLCQSAGECGNGTLCQPGFCCSTSYFCGTTDDYCGPGHCHSQCPDSPPPPPPPPLGPSPPPPPPSPPSPISSVISKEMFEEMLKNRNNDPHCAIGFYTYESFIEATKRYPAFGNTGDLETCQREIAAFFGQTSHETTGGWEGAPNGGPYAWGYCFTEEIDKSDDHCDDKNFPQWPCVPGKKYYGRGPMQLSWNYNYGPFGQSIGIDLLSNPDLVASDATISFEAAIWFWMTPQAPKPSCHDVIVGNWIPSQCDKDVNRQPGYGVITNIINGGLECDGRNPTEVKNRVGFYTRYCDMFGISYGGEDMDCATQTPFSEKSCATLAANIEMVVASA